MSIRSLEGVGGREPAQGVLSQRQFYSAPLSITARLFFYYSTPLFYYSAPLFITVRLFLLQRAYSFHSARQKQRAALFSVCGEASALCRTYQAAVFIRVASSIWHSWLG